MKKILILLCIFFLAAISTGQASADLLITGVVDGPLAGGLPKAVEFYVINDIADLSVFGFGSANNGGGTDGEEFTFPADSANAGDFIYVATEATGFTSFFGFAPNYTSGTAPSINGDDAIELFESGTVIDVFGDINVDGTGQPWEYLDGWAYRVDGTGPDGTVFSLADWSFSGPNALDGETTNATAASPFPIGTYLPLSGPDYTPIYDIQYTTDPSGDSPYKDQSDITTEGIVTAIFVYGYFIEDPVGGAWNGLWIYDTVNTPALGDLVRLTGTVIEYYNLTELDSLTEYTVLSSGNPIPGPEVLPSGDVSQEQWEGVLVRVENVTVTDEDLGFGEWSVSDGSGDVVIDDKGSYIYTPVNGNALAAVIGPLDYTFGVFKIQPRDDDDIILAGAPSLIINEIHADPDFINGDANGDGAVDFSDDEFVEIVNNSDNDLDISAWMLSDGFGIRHVFPAGTIVSAHCAVVIFGGGSPTGAFGGAVVQTASSGSLGLNNSGDTVTLNDGAVDQATAAYGSEGGDNQSLTLDPDIAGPSFVKHSMATGSGGALFSPGTLVDGSSFSGCSNGFGACGDPATFIHDIQGSGASSPLNGSSGIIIEGLVVGDFQDVSTGLKGFFVQEEDADADADPTTSEGIFVFDNGFGVDVNTGDLVRVMGTVTEYSGLTELTGISHVAVCTAEGSASAAIVNLPVSSVDVWEQYEGMSIKLLQPLYVTDNYSVGRYGEVDLSVDTRLYAPTNVVAPGAPAIALQDLNDRSRIQMDDGSTVQNPDPVPYLGLGNTLRAGDSIPGLSGVLSYSFGSYEVHPTDVVVFARNNSRDSTPIDVGGTLKVASFNVLNYFTTLDDGGFNCGPTGGLGCRGADTDEEFTRQRDKILNAMAIMDADVIGLMEIENHPTDGALQDLVNGLNDIAGPGTYNYIDTGPIGTDAIKVAFIYKSSSVTPVGPYAILDSSVDPTFLDTKNRPALAQTFQQNANGGKFTAVVNHLKSKGSSCDDVGDPDTGDGQGNCNLTRTSAATALVNWLATDPTGSSDSDFLIIGDLNAYAMEDPIAAIEGAGYIDLIEEFVATPYSYVYFGQAGYLDHALASSALTPQVTGVTVWHINADEPSALDYNDYNQPYLYNPDQYRSSDHDPVIIGLSVCEEIAPTLEVSVTPNKLWPPNHKYVKVKATVVATDNSDPNPTVTLVSVTSNEPDNGKGDGNTINDIVIVDDFTFKLRAERSGKGTGRVYTITYMASDDCGNSAIDQATVTVPHDKGKKKKLKKDKKHKKSKKYKKK